MTSKKTNGRHLTLSDRIIIETELFKATSISKIAKIIKKHPTTVLREIKKHRFEKERSTWKPIPDSCIHKHKCKKDKCSTQLQCFEQKSCPSLMKSPYVCNSCSNKTRCREVKFYYYSKIADDQYKNTFSSSRIGVNLTQEQIFEIDSLITPLIKDKHQSINHIYATHSDVLQFSKPTFYSYINMGIFSVKNIDLGRKVSYRPRKNSKTQRKRRELAVRKNRTIDDFLNYIKEHPDASIVEMDTVEGTIGGKVFLTLLFRNSKLMLIFLLEHQTMECVHEKFLYLKKSLGIDVYKNLFEVILTDNGSEFLNPNSMEFDENTSECVSHLFYCDPCASWQKGSLEKNHELIRYVLPKGSSFDNLTDCDTYLLMSHINSFIRKSLNNKAPYDASLFHLNKSTLDKLHVHRIHPDSVNLSKNLLKKESSAFEQIALNIPDNNE